MIHSFIRRTITVTGLAALIAVGATPYPASAAPLSLADSPLALLASVDPNLIFTYDDSGSMSWAFIPDSLGNDDLDDERRSCSSTFNPLYFDPNGTYDVPVDANGDPINAAAPTTFTAAYVDGFDTSKGTVNLATSYRATWDPINYYGPQYAGCGFTGATTINTTSPYTGTYNSARPAFYFTYNAGCGNTNDSACYNLVQHNNGAAGGAWTAAMQQKFANWYSYYRTRTLLAKSAAGRTFQGLSDTVRLAYQRLNSCNGGFGIAPTASCPGSYVQPMTAANKATFLNWLYKSPASGGTPLRSAFVRAGQYLSSTSNRSPWAENPNVAVGTEHACRQTFHVAFTDGVWNDNVTGYGNVDNSTVALPAYDLDASRLKLSYHPGNYAPGSLPANRKPYPDANSNSLADIAFYFWSRDARASMPNKVPQYIINSEGSDADKFWHPDNDPATWQHLVNYTVGLGVAGNLNPTNYFDRNQPNSAGHWDELMAGGPPTWGATASNSVNNVDDLWHAAVNSRGRFFSARSASQMVEALQSALNDALARTGSAAALSANSGSVSASSLIYQASYNSTNWSGNLMAYGIDTATNTPNPNATWNAATRLNDATTGLNYTNRKIITYKPSTRAGTAFRWNDIDTSQQNALHIDPATAASDGHGEARLDYLRGASANEGQGLNFRVRGCTDIDAKPVTCAPDNGKLGDIVNSSPLFVGRPPFRYRDSFEAKPYSAFAASNANRTPVVYVGANDGMLHGFNANTGEELIAYVPSPVYANLNRLPWRSYSHRYYVDGSPTVGDVFIKPKSGAADWRTVLVGGLNKGGRGYFALDVTDPSQFKESNAANLVLWEFTSTDDADLGHSYSQPSIVKMANGKWAAIFGSGYNNVSPGTGEGFVYIVFIEGGVDGTWTIDQDYVKLRTNAGDTTTPNGIAGITTVDVNRDDIADYIYAADLQGNLWRFDVTNPKNDPEAAWIAAIKDTTPSAKRRTLLFQTKSGRPITHYPAVARHPLGGLLVYFGTGKYLESSDNNVTGAPTETFYAIWDRGLGETVPTNRLLAQTVTGTNHIGNFDVRVTSNNAITWATASPAAAGTHLGWYLDLPTTGERITVNPLVREGKIIFSTYIPTTVPCEPGGDGWLMELDGITGGRLTDTFDLDENGVIDTADRFSSGGAVVASSGVRTGGTSGVTVLSTNPNLSSPPKPAGECVEVKLASTQDKKIVRMQEKCKGPSRESWIQSR